jgi:hypothetical protein
MALAVWAAPGLDRGGPGLARVEPLTRKADDISELASSVAVIAFMRRGVTHEKCLAAM